MGPWLAALAVAGVTVEVAPNPCTSSVAVAAAVARRTDAAVTLRLEPAGEDLRLTLEAPNQPPASRPLGVGPADCALVPELVAVLTERYVRALPAWTWAPRSPPAPPRSEARARASPTPPALHPRWRLVASADVGAGLGFGGAVPGARGRVEVALVGGRFGGAAFGAVGVTPDRAFGADGRLTVVQAGAGVAAVLREGPIRASLGVAAGVSMAQASGFERASSSVEPLLEAELRGLVALPLGLYAGASAQLPLVRRRYVREELGLIVEEPGLTVGLVLGFAHAVAFF